MPDIPIRVTGTGLETFDRIANGFRKAGAAAQGAAGASRVPIGGGRTGPLMANEVFPGVRMGNFGSGFTPAGWERSNPRARIGGGGGHGGGGGGFRHGLHGLSRGIGGAAGEGLHRIGAIGGIVGALGPLGLGLAAAGIAVNAFAGAGERAAERTKMAFESIQKYAEIKLQGAATRQSLGLEAAGESGGLRQLANQGLLSKFKEARAGGFSGSAESFASLRGDKGRIDAVMMATRLGVDADTAAGMAKNLGAGINGGAAGRFIAQQSLGRVISDREVANAKQLNAGNIGTTGQLNQIDTQRGRTANTKLGYLQSGQGVQGANLERVAAEQPEAVAASKMQYEFDQQQAMMHAMAESAGRLSALIKDVGVLGGGAGSINNQANAAAIAHAAGALSQE